MKSTIVNGKPTKHVWDPETQEFIPEKTGILKQIQSQVDRAYARIRSVTAFQWMMTIALILRMIHLGHGAFWYDEGVSIVLSRLPLDRMINATAGDVHPPLYYLILWLFARTGIPLTEFIARIPSVIFSLLAVVLTWKILNHPKMTMTRLGKYIVMAWIIISPLQLHYAQETRMYALLQIEVLAGILFILDRRKILLIGIFVLLLYTHNYAVFYIPTFAVALLIEEYRYIFDIKTSLYYWIKEWWFVFVAPLILWIPWIITLVKQMQTVSAGYWIQPVKIPSIIFVLYQMLFAYSMPPTFQGLGILVTCGLLFYTAWRVYKSQPQRWLLLVTLSFLPLSLSVIVSIVWKPVLLFRGLIGTAIPLTILVVKGIEKISVPYKRAYAYGLIFATLIAGTAGHYLYNAENKGTTTTWVKETVNLMHHGDAVLALNDNGIIAMKTYAPDVPLYKLTGCGEEPWGSLSPATRSAIGIIEKSLDELIWLEPRTFSQYNVIAGDPDELRDYHRIFFISTVAPISPKCEVDQANEIIDLDGVELIKELANDEYAQAGIYKIVSREY